MSKLDELKKLRNQVNLVIKNLDNYPKDEINVLVSNHNCLMDIFYLPMSLPEEIRRAASSFNAKTLLVKRVGLANIETNYSDANVDNYPYDYMIENTTLDELDSNALDFVCKLKGNNQKVLKM